jgi:chromosome segregation ATPase
MKAFFSVPLVAVLLFSSCNFKSSDYKALQEQNDSLMRAKQQMQDEIDEYFSAMNQIEQNIEKIKETQGVLQTQPESGELNEDTRTKINDDLLYLNEMLQTNKDELARLKSKLKKSALKSDELERSIARLTKALEEESSKVAILQAELAAKDSLIADLGTTVNTMGKDIESLKTDNETKQSRITEQEETIHTAWYVFGTRKELKEQRIITSEGIFSAKRILQSDFNKNYFVRIDARKTKSIPLYSTSAKILTSHPKSSYTLEKENDNFVLLITDTKDFWSVSKYLVIEVD